MKNRIAVLLALFGLGAFSIPSQIYFVREALALFNGNEMALGTVIGLWLLLTGAGAWLARTFPVKKGAGNFSIFLMLLFSVIPIIALFKLQLWKSSALLYGSVPGLWEIFYSCLVALLPCCLLNGYLFILLTSLLEKSEGDNAPGKAYAWESLGGLVGGAAVNFILLWYVDTLSALRVSFVFFVVLILIISTLEHLHQPSPAVRRLPSAVILLSVYLSSLLLILFIFLFPFKQLSFHAQYKEQSLILDKDTPYGRITITKSGEQLNYYGDGTLLFSSGNTMWNEESVHYAMLQRTAPKNILLIGGGVSGTIPEILKYRPGRIDYIEINPVLADLARKYIGNTHLQNVFVHQADVRSFLRGEERRYDVILVNVPEPSSLQLNRYYTQEFLRLLKNHMTPAGVTCFSLPATTDYVSPEAGQMNASFFQTLKSEFRRVIIVPGNRNWFLGSDGSLSLEIARLSDERITGDGRRQTADGNSPSSVRSPPSASLAFSTQFVNSFYIDDGLLLDRSNFILKNLPQDVPVNRDFHPVIYHHQLSVWLSQFGIKWPVVLGGVALIFILVLFMLNRTGAGLFAGGFTGASLEIIVMLAFQVAFGFVFSMAGVVIMLFMAGLAIAPWLARKFFPFPVKRHFILLMLLMSSMPLLMLGIIGVSAANQIIPYALYIMHFIYILVVSLVVGMQYTVATAITPGDSIRAASRNYAADLFGSALGAFLVPVVFLPVMGIGLTILLLSVMNLVAIIFFLTTKGTKVSQRPQ